MSADGLEQIKLRNFCLLSDDLMALVGFSFVDDLSLPRGPLPIWYAKQKEYQGNRYGYHCNDGESKHKTVLCMLRVQ